MQMRALVLTGYGINCDYESAYAVRKVGGAADQVHVNELIADPSMLEQYNLLFIPGGFSYGDDLGSGKMLGNKLKFNIKDDLLKFHAEGKLILGVCNGFQALVKMGLLPVPDLEQRCTLSFNDSGKFEDRWVAVSANPSSPCIFTKGIGSIPLPIRHGEGKFIAGKSALSSIVSSNLHTLQYVSPSGSNDQYPYNPNGAMLGIAGLCDATGRIFGMMPHPEAFNHPTNHPHWAPGRVPGTTGLAFFKNAADYLATL
ncbi:MAG: phosphoribosylformylglycinamidine synthase subunit PurQ [Candidatus Bilamarchaeaceae archaeon]